MKIYTKTGDAGSTGLYGGKRVRKDDLRVNAYGSVDEANAVLGLARAQVADEELEQVLAQLQNVLFDLGADLATPLDSVYRKNIAAINEDDIENLEGLIDRFEIELKPLKAFILPGGHPAAATLHLARAIARRAERAVVHLQATETLNELTMVYLNRLADLLFVLARAVNARAGVSEDNWQVKGRV